MFKHGFPPEWSTFKKLIWLVGSGIAGAASGIWKTVTGSLIHITDAIAAPMQKCEVTLEPIQDLHGQDAPYPAGGGKNKISMKAYNGIGYNASVGNAFDLTELDDTTTTENTVSRKAGDWGRMCFISDYLPTGTYRFYTKVDTTSVAESHYVLDSDKKVSRTLGISNNGSSTLTVDGDITLSGDEHYIALYTANKGTSSDLTVTDLGVYAGAGAKQYHPYSNICPITGWTGCEVTRTGKNLLEPKFYNGGAYNGDVGRQFTFTEDTSVVKTGNVYSKSVGSWGHVTLVSSLLKVGMYKINIAVSAPSVRSTLYVFDKDFRVLFKSNTTNPQTWSNTPGLHEDGYIAVYLASSTEGTITFTEPQIEIGETFTGYEEYSGTTLSVTFPDTVYGGKYNFVDGKGDSNLAEVDLGTLDWVRTSYSSNYFFYSTLVDGSRKDNPTGLCSSYPMTTDGSYAVDETCRLYGSSVYGFSRVAIRDDKYSDTASFKAAMSGVQLVYELAEPTEISLTPQEISTLKGVNNVWSNTNGNTTIIYKAQAE